MQALEHEIKELIISSLSLEDISADDIDTGAPLFVEGLGLDSIDALELGLALQKRYGVALSADSQETRRQFASVRAIGKPYCKWRVAIRKSQAAAMTAAPPVQTPAMAAIVGTGHLSSLANMRSMRAS